jgi:hypothetical protein
MGLSGGFFGSIIFAPEGNQRPMLGFFITGPWASSAARSAA